MNDHCFVCDKSLDWATDIVKFTNIGASSKSIALCSHCEIETKFEHKEEQPKQMSIFEI